VPKIEQKKAQLPLIFTREQTIPAFSPPNCQIGVPKGLIPFQYWYYLPNNNKDDRSSDFAHPSTNNSGSPKRGLANSTLLNRRNAFFGLSIIFNLKPLFD